MLKTHLLKTPGNTTPGVVPEILVADKTWFTTIATAPSTETTQGEDVMITDDHIFSDPAFGFVKLEMTDRTAMVKYEQAGELDGESINAVVEGFAPGLHTGLLSFMGQQFSGIVLIQDLRCSVTRYYQIGTACSVAYKKGWGYDTGIAGGEGRKGMKVRFEAVMEKPLIYTGAIVLAEQPSIS
jgi:hypothetical protein